MSPLGGGRPPPPFFPSLYPVLPATYLYYRPPHTHTHTTHLLIPPTHCSTKELETCLLSTPGGKCVFEMLASWCSEGIAEVLTCHKSAMHSLLEKVLSPPFENPQPPTGEQGLPPPLLPTPALPARAAALEQPQQAAPAPAPAPVPAQLSAAMLEWGEAVKRVAALSLKAAEEQNTLYHNLIKVVI